MTYLISGCGVSMICDQSGVLGWVEYILDKGGTPQVSIFKDYSCTKKP
jgi:hypothetical protein